MAQNSKITKYNIILLAAGAGVVCNLSGCKSAKSQSKSDSEGKWGGHWPRRKWKSLVNDQIPGVDGKSPSQRADQAFDYLDKDGSGAISSVELKKSLCELGQTLTEAEIEKMIHAIDENGDGEITRDEFYKMLMTS